MLLALGLAAPLASLGQDPQPLVPDLKERSGLLGRFIPITPNLPPDRSRDTWYDTRWGDVRIPHRVDNIRNGGLYGFGWKGDCTATVAPYFYGTAAGQVGPECRPGPRSLRVFQGLVHPFKPVGMYYDQGAYVPLYDLDPFVPGPGPYPIPWFFRNPKGG